METAIYTTDGETAFDTSTKALFKALTAASERRGFCPAPIDSPAKAAVIAPGPDKEVTNITPMVMPIPISPTAVRIGLLRIRNSSKKR
jgi:hypothetical protein